MTYEPVWSLSQGPHPPGSALRTGQVLENRAGGSITYRARYTDVPHTLDLMAAYARRDRIADPVRHAAHVATQGVDVQDRHEVARSVWRYIKNRVRWVPDSFGVELVQTPVATLRYKYADCDGQATLAAAMLSSLGIPTGFEAIAHRREGVFDHVYAVYFAGDEWHMIDPTTTLRPGPDTQRPTAHNKIVRYLHDQDHADPMPSQVQVTGSGLQSLARRTPGLAQANIETKGSEEQPELEDFGDYFAFVLASAPAFIEAFQDDSQETPSYEEFLRQQQQQNGNGQQREAGFFSSTVGQLAIGGTLLALAGVAIYSLAD